MSGRTMRPRQHPEKVEELEERVRWLEAMTDGIGERLNLLELAGAA